MRFVIVTGMSGAGKTTALKMLEDMGYFCVDNLPIPLLTRFVEMFSEPEEEVKKIALGLDVREDRTSPVCRKCSTRWTRSRPAMRYSFWMPRTMC